MPWFGNGSLILNRPMSGTPQQHNHHQFNGSAAEDDNVSYIGAVNNGNRQSASSNASKMFSLNYPPRSSRGSGGFLNNNGSLMMSMISGNTTNSNGSSIANPNSAAAVAAAAAAAASAATFAIPASPIQTASKRPQSMGAAQRGLRAQSGSSVPTPSNTNGMPSISTNRTFLSSSFSEGTNNHNITTTSSSSAATSLAPMTTATSSVSANLSRSLQSPISMFMDKNSGANGSALLAGYAGLRRATPQKGSGVN